VKRYLENP